MGRQGGYDLEGRAVVARCDFELTAGNDRKGRENMFEEPFRPSVAAYMKGVSRLTGVSVFDHPLEV